MNKAEKLFDDLFAAFMITFTMSAFVREAYVSENVMKVVRAVTFIAFAAFWIAVSVKNGQKNNFLFIILTVVFWILPLVIIYLSNEGPEVFRMSIICYVLSEFFDWLINTPLIALSRVLGISSMGAAAVVVLLLLTAYFLGVFIAAKDDESRNNSHSGFSVKSMLKRFKR